MLLKERKQGFYFCLCPTRIEFNKCSKQNITANLGSYSGIGGRIGQQMLAWVAIFMLSWIHRNLGVLLLPSALCFKSVQCFAKLVRHLGLNVHVMFICQVTALFQVERVVYSSMLPNFTKIGENYCVLNIPVAKIKGMHFLSSNIQSKALFNWQSMNGFSAGCVIARHGIDWQDWRALN